MVNYEFNNPVAKVTFPFINNDIFKGNIDLNQPKYGLTFKKGIYQCRGGA